MMFLAGRHRLAIARLLGLPRIPVKIVLRYASWVEFQERIWQYAEQQKSGKIYQRIHHPDLEHIPANYDGRIEPLRRSLNGFRAGGRRLVDIGSHWGQMCHWLEDEGYQCTAVEKSREHVVIMDRLRIACSKRFSIYHGDVFNHPSLEQFEVVVALNILHHFCKTEAGHDKLVRLLRRLRPKLMLFQAHTANPPGQMKGAYRNYEVQDFVAFIKEHTGLRHAEHVASSRDGRPIFKLWYG